MTATPSIHAGALVYVDGKWCCPCGYAGKTARGARSHQAKHLHGNAAHQSTP